MNQISEQEFEIINNLDLSGISSVPSSAFEKDIHITKVLRILAFLNLGDWRMIFCGGTSLSKAHEVVNRMSEDIDIQLVTAENMSLSQKRRQLSLAKTVIQSHLNASGYMIETTKAVNNNTHFSFNVAYRAKFDRALSLRNEIKIEMIEKEEPLSTQRQQIRNLYQRFVSDDSEVFEFESVSVEQTVSEKVVAFLRRSISVNNWDPRLVRHLYDVHQIASTLKLGDEVFKQFDRAIEFDRSRYRKVDKEFKRKPINFLAKSLENLEKQRFAEDYSRFAEDLVFGDSPSYEEVTESFLRVARELLDNSGLISK